MSSPPPVFIPPPPSSSVTLPALPSLSALSGSQTSILPTGSSASPFPTASSNRHGALPPFKLAYVVPVVAVVGIVVAIAIIWLVQGCCTRKAKVIDADPELLGGPRYEFIEPEDRPSQRGQQYEEKLTGYHQADYALQLGYEQVAWAGHTGYHQAEYSAAYIHDSAPDNGPSMRLAVPTPASDATSAGLLEMYESDSEKDEERRQQEPWETLRHRSIKRGILETVQKDNGWMDSLRAVAGSTFVNQGHSKASAASRPFPPKSRRRESEAWIDDVKQRRAKAASRSRSNMGGSGGITANDSYLDKGSTPWSEEVGFKIVQESPPSSAPTIHQQVRVDSGDGDLQARSSNRNIKDKFTSGRRQRGRAGTRDYFNYKLPPVGSSSIPMDKTINGVGGGAREPPTRISMLPISPPRIMSPPLENQLLFTPNPDPNSNPNLNANHFSPSKSSAAWRNAYGNANSSGNTTLLSRLTERSAKGKAKARSGGSAAAARMKTRKASPDVTRGDNPLPLPSTEPVAPLRAGKRVGKLVKTRTVAEGKYRSVSGRGPEESSRHGAY